MIPALLFTAAALVALWAVVAWVTSIPDHAQFDEPVPGLHHIPGSVSAENQRVLDLIAALQARLAGVPKLERIRQLRRIMDEGFTGSPMDADKLGVDIRAAADVGVEAEWTVAPNVAAARRLLYLHGGGFAAGSHRSHRMITAALSRACQVSVLSIDYRQLPESRRIRTVHDCQLAYRWMLDNGPDGPGPADDIFVAGDSAGGNLTLMLAAWVRDAGLRRMNAAVAFCPNTDASLTNPVIRRHLATDPLLGPGLKPLLRLPVTVRMLLTALGGGMLPRNPRMSPLFGDLAGLPPILIQASDREMLLGDAVRYANKAVRQGAPVHLQVWPGMVHVWHMFQHVLPEARLAIDEVAAFLDRNGPAAAVGADHG